MDNKIKMNGHSITASNISEILLINDKVQQKVLENKKSLEDMIAELPENFPEANPIIKNDIFPQMLEMDHGLIDFYIVKLQKKLSVGKQTIKEALKSFKQEIQSNGPESDAIVPDNENAQLDPEIIEKAEQIALDPQLAKKRIDMVNSLGIINERLNIGVICMTIDSRLNPMGIKGSKVLATKITGVKGSGKTAALMAVKELYSNKCYHYLNSGSAKSIYNMDNDALEHKALILGEAFAFQGNNSNDSEFTHVVRCLVSEGFVTYQYTGFDSAGRKMTRYTTVNGPTPLITTSIYSTLEGQLDDRMFSVHPDTSAGQTSAVLSIEAKNASGANDIVEEQDILVWRTFHDSLEVLDVIIPFAIDIHAFLIEGGELPISARRSFNRVLNSIRTISLLYQKQRAKDDQGRLIADIADYSLAYQLVDSAFREGLGAGKYSDRRLILIEKIGLVTPRDLAQKEGVSGAAISSWSKHWLDNGVLIWCDNQGVTIKEDQLNRMKRSGKAYLKVVGLNRLPTPFELTGDQRWDVGGEFYHTYDLGLDKNEDLINNKKEFSEKLNTSDAMKNLENIDTIEDMDQGVKVLRDKSGDSTRKKSQGWDQIMGFDDIIFDVNQMERHWAI